MAISTGKDYINPSNDNTGNIGTKNQQPFTSAMFGIPSRNNNGVGDYQLEKFYALALEIIKKENEAVGAAPKASIYKVLREATGLHYSVLLISKVISGKLFAYPLVFSSSNDDPPPKNFTYNQQPVVVMRTPGEAFDGNFLSGVKLWLEQNTSHKQNEVVLLEGLLLVKDAPFTLDEESKVKPIIGLAHNAIDSQSSIDPTVGSYKGLNLYNLMTQVFKNGSPESVWEITTQYNGGSVETTDVRGLPVRKDIALKLALKQKNNQRNTMSIHRPNDGDIHMSTVYGYVEFERIKNDTNYYAQPDTRIFRPNFVITHIESPWALTPDHVMMAFATATYALRNHSWLASFQPQLNNSSNSELFNITGLNLEGCIVSTPAGAVYEPSRIEGGPKLNIKDDPSAVVKINNLVTRLIDTSSAIISVDINASNELSYALAVFQQAACGNHVALKQVKDFLAVLTNGNAVDFNKVFTPLSNLIHGGYYTAKVGKDHIYRDLRDLGLLALCNYLLDTNQSRENMVSYYETLYSNSCPVEFRAAMRLGYLQRMSGGAMVVHNYHQRYSFDAGFIDSLLNGLNSVGWCPTVANMSAGNDMFATRQMYENNAATLNVSMLQYNNAAPANLQGGLPFGYGQQRYGL